VGRHARLVTEPLHPIDVRLARKVDAIARPARLTPVERELERERREQARKRRREPPPPASEKEPAGDGHVDLRA
jgi:hypothetical protein